MGQITLERLTAVGDAAVRLAQWLANEGGTRERLLAYRADISAAALDIRRIAPPRDFRLGQSWHAADRGRWHVELVHVSEDAYADGGAHWVAVLGEQARSADPHVRALAAQFGVPNEAGFLRYALEVGVPPRPLTVRVQIPGGPGMAPIELLDRLTPRPDPTDSPVSRAQLRGGLQGLDAYAARVAVDPSWDADPLRASVMAQLAEWCVRVDGRNEQGTPLLGNDALQWWQSHASQVRGAGEAVAPSELYEIAGRTVASSSPAAHRKYWRKSLHAHHDSLVEQAMRAAGVSRRTLFARLERGRRRLADFRAEDDPLAALTRFLRGHAPNRLPEARKEIQRQLVAAGMSREAARKLERRIRPLDPEVQLRRVLAARARALKRASQSS